MKKTLFKTAGIILVGVLFLFTSCDDSNRFPEISDIGWTIENIDTDFWSYPSTSRSANLDIWIVFEESELLAQSISSVAIIAPTGRSWIYDDPDAIAALYDEESQVFGGWLRLFSTYYSSNASVLPIGEYEFDVTYITGKTVTRMFTIPEPGSTSAGSVAYVYTENYPYSPGSDYTALPKRAYISSCAFTSGGSEVTVDFSIDNDSKIYNCKAWFYDSSGDFVGESGWLRDFTTGSLSSTLNSGAGLYTDGTTNSIILPVSSIDYSSGKTSSDLHTMRIVLTDGKQYISSAEVNGYDTRSISGLSLIQ